MCEISDPEIRPITSAFWMLFFIAGESLSILACNWLCWRSVAGFLVMANIICIMGILWIHDTPGWLLETGKFEQAEKALNFYNTDPNSLIHRDKKENNGNTNNISCSELVEWYRKTNTGSEDIWNSKQGNAHSSNR